MILADITEVARVISNLIVSGFLRAITRILDSKERIILWDGGGESIRRELITEGFVAAGKNNGTELAGKGRRIRVGWRLVEVCQVDQSVGHDGG